jgi:hypothetical protein
MKTPQTRREFLADVGRGMMIATVGLETAAGLGLSNALAAEPAGVGELSFGAIEPLVRLMQETSADRLLPELAARLRSGTELRQLVAAAALANARTFGGEDYVGFHTMMALAPAFHMAQELPAASQALPVFKVLYRNTNRIQEYGGRKNEVLRAITPLPVSHPKGRSGDHDLLRQAVRQKDVNAAEQTFAALARDSVDDAFNHLLVAVQDNTEVHRVVLPYRAWDMLGIIGREQAHTLLRQSVRYCVKVESSQSTGVVSEPRTLLPKLLDEHRLLGRAPGTRTMEDGWVEEFSQTVFKSSPSEAGSAAAAALAEGIDPAAIGEALTLAANQLVLRDMGRTPRAESPGKPIGSVHGDSIGVHATDSANAWRNLARVSNARNRFASLILGSYQVAVDRAARGGDFLNWAPLPYGYDVSRLSDPAVLLRELDEAIRGNLQSRATALVHQYGELGLPSKPVFDLLLRYAISEDGSLHAEKFYRTCSEEFASTRRAFRWRHLIALARVTASEFGRPAPGMAAARELLKVT